MAFTMNSTAMRSVMMAVDLEALTSRIELGSVTGGSIRLRLAALVFIALSCWFIYSIYIYPFHVSPFRHLPMPPGNHWLWGHAPTVLKGPKSHATDAWMKSVPNDGLIRFLWFFNKERILVTSPKGASEVLVTKSYTFQKPRNARQSAGRIIGFGLVLAEGGAHKLQRKNLMPAFAFRHIKNLYPVFWGNTLKTISALEAELDDTKSATVEIQSWAARCTLDILGEAGMGKNFGAIQNEKSEIMEAYKTVFEPSRQAIILRVVGSVLPIWIAHALPIKHNDDMGYAGRVIRKFCADLIQEKRNSLGSIKSQGEKDIISVAMSSAQFSDEDLVDQLMTFLAAGHETTGTALTWTIYELAKRPDIQVKLRQEIRESLGSLSREISSPDIERLPFLNAVCNESLRFWSPIPHTVREAAEDTTIVQHPIPRGTRIIVSASAANKDPHLWGDDAHIFDPLRWISNGEDAASNQKAASGGASSNYAFLTFLQGPRSCIGESFARAELACMLAGLVGKFSFELRDQELVDESLIPIKRGIVARPLYGIHVIIRDVPGF